ncbi:MAG: Holliday junction resolvase RuvX [candidate division FCPU426 bacterium]
MGLPGRVLGVDYGSRRIGLALSDPLGLTAQPLVVLANREKTLMSEIAALVRDRQVVRIVVGLPRRLSGEEGPAAEEVRAFGEQLALAAGVTVEYADERLTTAAAQRVLSETNMSGAKKRAVADKLAATLILQTWLDRQKKSR